MAAQIAVPQTGQLPKVKGPEINDRDRINDILSFEKYLTNGYNTGLNEMQNPKLRQTVFDILNDIHQLQFKIFDTMFQKGWYKMKAADQQEIGQIQQQFANYKTQFPQF
ncbi:spore coat protein [Paenibacillus hamazuiensis]|uniref:spore coat protein n=1 Tax=Paenibacillus hamazuiensis TaxID=2936508 RepID=UPI00200DFE3D|nr:spore coat protein [Paenibacillus hamazuiensis]